MNKEVRITLTIITIIAGLLLLHATMFMVHVEGTSMEPTIHNRQLAIIETWPYWLRDPQRGDIIVFAAPPDPAEMYIKRIIGIPGDIISISGGTVTEDGTTLNEPYIAPWLQGNPNTYQHLYVTVPANCYFVMGDDRMYSSDSRTWGFVPRNNIIGKAVFLLGSSDNSGFLPDESPVFDQIQPQGTFSTSMVSQPSHAAIPTQTSLLLYGYQVRSCCEHTARKYRQNACLNP